MKVATAIMVSQTPKKVAGGSEVNDKTTGVAVSAKNKKRGKANSKKEEKEYKIEGFLAKIVKEKVHD